MGILSSLHMCILQVTLLLTESPNDQIPLPEWDRYLKSVSKITINEKNKEYKEFIKNSGLKDEDDERAIHKIEEVFERMIPEEDRKLLNIVKKKEIDAIRRRIIPRKKNLKNEVQIPTHLNVTVLKFTAQDIGLLIRANKEHTR